MVAALLSKKTKYKLRRLAQRYVGTKISIGLDMGFDCSYQGIPSKSEVLELALSDPEFSENVFFWLIRKGSGIEESSYYFQDDHKQIRELFSSNPEVRELHYCPSSRQYEALIHTLDPELHDMTYQEITESMPFKAVKGDKVFCDHLRGTQGVLVRHSDSSFIEKCVRYLQGIDKKILLENFHRNQSENRVVYKSSFTYFEPIDAYFNELLEFYKKVNQVKDITVFVAED